jgi:hypothetical protein
VSDYSSLGDMQHCSIPLPKPQVGPLHPFKNDKMHDKLLSYVRSRLFLGKEVRDTDIHRLVGPTRRSPAG